MLLDEEGVEGEGGKVPDPHVVGGVLVLGGAEVVVAADGYQRDPRLGHPSFHEEVVPLERLHLVRLVLRLIQRPSISGVRFNEDVEVFVGVSVCELLHPVVEGKDLLPGERVHHPQLLIAVPSHDVLLVWTQLHAPDPQRRIFIGRELAYAVAGLDGTLLAEGELEDL